MVALFALGLGAYATDDISLPLTGDTPLGSGWTSSYDVDTQTITFESAWTGRGWWLGSVDYSDYVGVEVVFTTSMTGSLNLIAQYNYYESYDEDGEGVGDAISSSINQDYTGTEGEQTIYLAFDEDMKDDVMQIYLQSSAAGDLTIVSATVISNDNADEIDTSYTLDLSGDVGNWNSGATRTAINDDGSVDLNFPGEWTSIGWSNWWPMWDLTPYKAVVVKYSNYTPTTATAKGVSTTDEDESAEAEAYLQLFMGGNNTSSTVADKENTGTITWVIDDIDMTGTDDDGNDYNEYEAIGQIYLQSSVAATVTINSITFVTSLDEDTDEEEGGESVDTSDYFVNLDFEEGDTGWTLYSDSKTQDADDDATIEISDDTNVTPGMDGKHFLANYGYDFTASTDVLSQKSLSELPAGTYTVSARINVGGSMDDIEFYVTDGADVDEYLAMTYDSADWTAEDRVSVTATIEEDSYLTIGIRTGADYPTAQWFWLIADNFEVEAAAGDETGISSVPAVTAKGTGAIYNLAGQRVNENAKGLLIKDGKKVLVK